jgi:arylsulfatase A-like enzyme/protein tyrosine phosphatase (PTP) superfamily phosphohydrolase (DUF442 family)
MIYSDSKKKRSFESNVSWFFILILVLVGFCGIGAAKPAEASPPWMAERLKIDGIDEFARIDNDIYRGAAPSDSGLRSLARAHVKTIICLQSDVSYKKTAQELGLRVVHIPLSTMTAPSRESILMFLDVASDPMAKPIFFHCRDGIGRTGVMTAIYRMQVQGLTEKMANAEISEWGGSSSIIDPNIFVSSFRETWLKAAKVLPDINASVGLAQALAKTGNHDRAFSEVRQAMIRAGSTYERIKVAKHAIKIIAEASANGNLPSYGFDLAEREWALLEFQGAEDEESLLALGAIFQRGLNLSRALDAFERAKIKAALPEKDLEIRVERIRTIQSYVPRSDSGKQLGLMPQVNRGELASLLVRELRVDRIRALHGSATWQATLDKQGAAHVVKDISGNPNKDDIKRVLALGVRGLETFSDQTFRPTAAVSRAEFVVIFEDLLTRATRDQTLPTQLLGKASRFDDVSADAWYQSAADLARSLGLFTPAQDDARKFKPLAPVTGLEALQAFRMLRKRLETRDRAIVVVVDALRAESVYSSLDNGRLPNLSSLIKDRGVVRIEKCLSALPSVTLPNHTTIFTGVYPGRHGVSGNEWFDRNLGAGEPLYRRTREYVKYGTEDDPGLGSSWSFGGVPIHDMDMSGKVRTIYEAFKEAETKNGRKAKTAVVFDPVRRGADKVVNPDVFDAIISINVLPFVNQFALMDASAMKKAVELIKSDDPPELMGIWLSGLDGWSHAHGPGPVGGAGDKQADYVAKNIDPLIGDLIKALEARGILDETVIFLVADHGQADTIGTIEYAIDAEKVYGALTKSSYSTPLDKKGHLDKKAKDFDVVVMANSNGNAALISVKTPKATWKTLPTQTDIEAVSALIIQEPYVSRIFYLGPVTSGNEPAVFMLTRGDDGVAGKIRLQQDSEERITVRTLGFAGSTRSGDILVEARSPYYFAPWGSIYKGQHGRRDSVEDHVPLLILNPPGGRKHLVQAVTEIVDIAPTVAGTLGFRDYLPTDGKDLLDPPRIIISSHGEDQVVPAGQAISLLGFVQDSVGVGQVEFRVGEEGAFIAAKGLASWEAQIKLTPGRQAIFIRAMDETGLQSIVRFHLVAR